MKSENLLLFALLGYAAYKMSQKTPTVVIETVAEEPTTVVLPGGNGVVYTNTVNTGGGKPGVKPDPGTFIDDEGRINVGGTRRPLIAGGHNSSLIIRH